MKAALIAGASLLVGCAAVIGADFDRPAVDVQGNLPAVLPDGGGDSSTALVDRSSQCPPGQEACACSACAEGKHAKAICNPTTYTCDLACDPGFDREGDRCVSWHVERSVAEDGALGAITGDDKGNLWVAGGPAQYDTSWDSFILHRDPAGLWNKEPIPGHRTITSIRQMATLEILATSQSYPPSDPFLIRAENGTWTAGPIGLPATDARDAWMTPTFKYVSVATGTSLRTFVDGSWQVQPIACTAMFGSFDFDELGPGGLQTGSYVTNNYTYCVAGKAIYTMLQDTWTGSPGTFSKATTGATSNLLALWGPGPKDLYAVGYNGNILHFSGTGWTLQPTDTTEALVDVWGSGPGDIYAVGTAGTILHSTGNGVWTHQASGTKDVIRRIWGNAKSGVYAVGTGFVLRRD